MSSLCCCRGLLSLFGVRGYPMDVVAKAKLHRAKVNRTQQNDYSTMNDDGGERRNGDVVRTEPHNLSDNGSKKSSKSTQRSINRRISSRRPRKTVRKSRRSAQSFDETDSNSSNDSEEESEQVIKKTLRKSLRSSRATLASIESGGSRGSGVSKRMPDVNVEHEPGGTPRSISPPDPSLYTSPPRRYREEDIIDGEGEFQSPDSQSQIAQNGATMSRSSIQSQQNGHSAFPYHEDEVSMEGTPRGSRKSKHFHRQALRKSPRGSPSLSVRSRQSVASSTAKWEMEDAGSIYMERRLGSRYRESDEDELAMAQKASEEANRSLGESDEEMPGQEPISSCGTLDVAVQYYLSEKRLQVTIIEAHDLPSKARGGSSIVQVRAVLLPEKKKKYKTKVQHISTPRFAETFKLTRASPDELRTLALRLRMYGIGKLKDRLIGEAVIRFDELNLIRDPQLTIQLQLEPRTDINRGESMSSLSNIDSRASSMMSLSHGGNPPEILIGLSYNAPTGRLCVEVVKGSHFRNLAMTKPPDTFVKLSLLNSACQEMSQSKTTIRRGQPNPVYKETFFFQVALFQLGEVTLMVSVYNKRTIKKKEMIGWVSMGRNSSSEIDEQHWHEMKEGKGQQVSRWHSLIDT